MNLLYASAWWLQSFSEDPVTGIGMPLFLCTHECIYHSGIHENIRQKQNNAFLWCAVPHLGNAPFPWKRTRDKHSFWWLGASIEDTTANTRPGPVLRLTGHVGTIDESWRSHRSIWCFTQLVPGFHFTFSGVYRHHYLNWNLNMMCECVFCFKDPNSIWISTSRMSIWGDIPAKSPRMLSCQLPQQQKNIRKWWKLVLIL